MPIGVAGTNGSKKLRKEIAHERKAPVGRYYQLLSMRATTGDYLRNKARKIPSDEYWWCGRNEKQSHHHLFVNCEAREPHIDGMWKDVETICE